MSTYDRKYVEHIEQELYDTRKALQELADASEEAASADPDMTSYADSERRFDAALDDARTVLASLQGASLRNAIELCPHEDANHKYGNFQNDATCLQCALRVKCISAKTSKVT